MPDAKTGDRIAARQCWECFKRRLVCDRTLPSCKKCTKTGKKCPGYNEQKPLQWVEPGIVTLRRKKKESRPTTSTISTRKSGRIAPAIPSGPDAAPEATRETSPLKLLGQGRCLSFQWPVVEELQLTPEAIELSKSQLANLLVQEDKPAWWRKLGIEKHVDPVELIAAEAGAGCGVGERIMCIGNKDQIKEVVERGQHWEAALLLQSNQRPLAKIQRLLEVMEMNRLPSYDFLSDETHDVVQAVNYSVVHFPVWALHILAPPMHYTTVCLSLNYHLTSSPLGKDRAIVADNRLKIYHYRGLAIRALNENVARKETRSSDQTITSILMFMAMEICVVDLDHYDAQFLT
ncbi:hypothetical protein J4E91_009299 [Alternaria rosae]|nr:hypothetical protein J4E91_009299 [Alternaria rosae]